MIRWDRSFQLDSLQGRAVRLRFHLREADLFALWFHPHARMGAAAFLPPIGTARMGPFKQTRIHIPKQEL